MISRWFRFREVGLGLAVFCALTCAAHAEPLVKLEGGAAKPMVVTGWSGKDKKVELDIRKGTDPKAVADAIQAQSAAKLRAVVKGDKVLVVGKTIEELLPELAKIELQESNLDGALAAANVAGDDDAGSGSSLRAKKRANIDQIMKDQKVTATGKVVAVEFGKFPEVVVTVQVLRPPTGPKAETLRRGAKIKFRPTFKRRSGAIDWNDADNQANLGANYLRAKDDVLIKFGAEQGGVFDAEVIDRP